MTTQTATAPKLGRNLYDQIAAVFCAGNDNGEGYPVGGDDSHINGLAIGEQIHVADCNAELAIYRDKQGNLIAVGDAQGPWAVSMSA